MTAPIVGFLHPGAMGSAMAREASADARWTGGRSTATAARADAAGMRATRLDELCATADVIVSICPPDAAEDVASLVAGTDGGSFSGIYVDANAVSPATARRIAARFDRFVDGSVVGPPPSDAMGARLYLSGTEAEVVADIWATGRLEPRVVGTEAGQASAVKMGYAGFTKGMAALVLDVNAYAEAEGVSDALLREFDESQPHFGRVATGAQRGAARKAWRFAGEMDEIAASYGAHDLPADFWAAAAEVYRRLAPFKDAGVPPAMDDIIRHLRTPNPGGADSSDTDNR